jgi:hypothetical protein
MPEVPASLVSAVALAEVPGYGVLPTWFMNQCAIEDWSFALLLRSGSVAHISYIEDYVPRPDEGHVIYVRGLGRVPPRMPAAVTTINKDGWVPLDDIVLAFETAAG